MFAVMLHPTPSMPSSSHQGRQGSEGDTVALTEAAILMTLLAGVSKLEWRRKKMPSERKKKLSYKNSGGNLVGC